MIGRILLLAALLALGAALLQWRLVKPAAPADTSKVERPGYYLTGVDLEEFGTDGKLRIGLQSMSAQEDPVSGLVRLSDVAVDYHAPTGRLWHLTSNEAHVPEGGRIVEFEGDVRLAGRPGDEPLPAELYAARMSLDTEGEVADTRSPVELVFGTHRIRALGMHADLKAGSLRLESDVNGRFVP
jgi:LPS export ABC transporter protein LptC